MRILWLNWRDIKNPEAGGAEIFTHEVAKRLAAKNHQITLLSAMFNGAKREEVIDNIHIVRTGNKYTVFLKAKEKYLRELSQEGYDVVIDEIHTRPFMTPKYVKEPILALIHAVAKEEWFYETPFPISFLGCHILVPYWLKHYVEIPTATVSESTKRDLEELGFKEIYVVPEGLSVEPVKEMPRKNENPLIVFLSRLKRYKRPDHAIKAFKLVKREIPNAELWIVGDGDLKRKLEKTAFEGVKVLGRVPHEQKIEILKRAWVLVHPAVREGWGLNVIEANALGTPVVAYNVPGLRDSVRHMETGILVEDGNIEKMAEAIITLIEDNELRERLSKNAIEWAKRFSWDKTAEAFERILKERFS